MSRPWSSVAIFDFRTLATEAKTMSDDGELSCSTLSEFLDRYKISKSTWKRMRARGQAPVLTWATKHNPIIRKCNEIAWLDARTESDLSRDDDE
jgi:hypothetical protein